MKPSSSFSPSLVLSVSSSTAVRRRRLLATGLLVIVGALPLLLGADRDDRAVLEQNRRRIEAMSAAERARLEYHFRTYRELSDSERAQYRALHEALEQDGRLRQVLEDYTEWLKTLTPWQRDELRKAADDAARMQLVRRFQQEQRSARERSRGGLAFDPRRGFDPRSRFSRDEQANVTAALMGAVRKRTPLTADMSRELPNLSPARQYVRILSVALRPSLDGQRPAFRWPDDALIDEMIAALPEDGPGRWIREMRSDSRRFALRRLLLTGLQAEWQAEAERHAPGEQQLQRFVSDLESDEQVRISRLSPEEARRRLTWQYLTRNPPAELSDDLEEYERLRRHLSAFSGWPGGRPRPEADDRPPRSPRGRD